MKLAIGIETKVRELNYWLWVGANWLCYNHENIFFIGNKGGIKRGVDLILPDIVVEAGFDPQFAKNMKEANIKYPLLHPEGGVYPSHQFFLDVKMKEKKEEVDLLDHICAWGEFSRSSFLKIRDIKEEKLTVTGTPYFDLMDNRFRNFYKNQVNHIKKRFGNFILLPTSFGWANHFCRSLSDTKKRFKSQLVDEIVDNKNQLYKEYLDLFERLAIKFKEKNLIIRRHPSEDPTPYEKLAEQYDNLYSIHQGSIHPWILAADAVIHSPDCTTGIEAAFAEKPRITYQPEKLSDYGYDQVLCCTNHSPTIEGVIDYIRSKAGKKESFTEQQKKKEKKYIDNVNHLAAPKIVEQFQKIVKDSGDLNKNLIPQPSLKERTKRILDRLNLYEFARGGKKTIFSPFDSKADYVKQKRGRITVEELEQKMETLFEIAVELNDQPKNCNLKVNRIKGLRQAFKIEI